MNVLLSKNIYVLVCLLLPAAHSYAVPLWTQLKPSHETQQVGEIDGQPLLLNVYTIFDAESVNYGLKFCWVRLLRNKAQFRVHNVQELGKEVDVFEKTARPGDIALVNGGFFSMSEDLRYSPLGLVVCSGKTVSRLNPSGVGGIFFRQGQHSDIVALKTFSRNTSVDEAIQCLPILVKDGIRDVFTDRRDLFDRTCVAIGHDGSFIIGGAFGRDGIGPSLYEFADLLAVPSGDGGPGIRIALAMDGGPGAHLYFPQKELHFGSKCTNFVPNIITFF